MTREEFLGAYNIGHRDGKAGEYLPNDYDDIFHIEEPKTDVLEQIKAEIAYAMDYTVPAWKGQDNYDGGLAIALSIIDKAQKKLNE